MIPRCASFLRRYQIRAEATWIPFGQALVLMAGLVAVRILTELISPEEYGRLSLVTGIVSMVTLAIFTSLGKAANRSAWDYANRNESAVLVTGILLLCLIIGLAAILTLLIAQYLGADFHIAPEIAFWAIPVFLVGGAIYDLYLGIFNVLRQRRVFVIGSVAKAWLQPLLATVAILVIARTAEAIMIGYAAASLLLVSGILILIRRKYLDNRLFGSNDLRSLIRSLLPYTASFVVVHLLHWAQITGNRYILDIQLGVERVGIFVVAVMIGRTPIQLIEAIFTQIHQPVLFQSVSPQPDNSVSATRAREAVAHYLAAFFVTVIPVVCFSLAGGDVLIRLLAGRSYWEGAAIIPWVALAEFGRCSSAAVASVFEVERRPRSLILPTAVGAVATLSLTALLSPTLGTVGAGVALVAGSSLGLSVNVLGASRLRCWSMPWRPFATSLVLGIGLAGFAWLCYDLTWSAGQLFQSLTYIAVFGLGFLMYSGRSLLT